MFIHTYIQIILILAGLVPLCTLSENLYSNLSGSAKRFLALHNLTHMNCTPFLPKEATRALRNLTPQAHQTLSHYFLHQCLVSLPYDKKFPPLLFTANYNPNFGMVYVYMYELTELKCSSLNS